MGYRLSDQAPAYALLILAGLAIVAVVVVITEAVLSLRNEKRH